MDRLGLAESGSGFAGLAESLSEAVGHRDRAGPLRDYCAGLLTGCERKSVEPLAAITAPARVSAQHQSLLHFVGRAPWSDDATPVFDPSEGVPPGADHLVRHRHTGIEGGIMHTVT